VARKVEKVSFYSFRQENEIEIIQKSFQTCNIHFGSLTHTHNIYIYKYASQQQQQTKHLGGRIINL